MKKIYHLSSCNTCQRIIKDLAVPNGFEFQDIKAEPISPAQLEIMCQLAGSYEALFSKKARKFRALQLNNTDLEETDYRDLIIKEYTFLKRPVIIINNKIFIGNSRKSVEAIKEYLGKN